jgi:hypothetical protein
MTVEICDAVERPTAVVAAATTWPEFPRLWKTLLDEVYAAVDGKTNVMLYRDDVPHVEVGVLAPEGFVPQGRVIASALPGGRVARAVHRIPPGFRRRSAGRSPRGRWASERPARPRSPRPPPA